MEFAGGVDHDGSNASEPVQCDVVRVKKERSSTSRVSSATQVPQPSSPLSGCLSQVVASLRRLREDLGSDEEDSVSSFIFPSQSHLISLFLSLFLYCRFPM